MASRREPTDKSEGNDVTPDLRGALSTSSSCSEKDNEPRKRTDAAARRVLRLLAEIVPDLATALGPHHELVVHDLRLIPNSIIGIGGDITGRSIGGPITDFLLRAIRQGETESIFRYQARTADGRSLSSSTVFIRQADGTPVGCLCVNTDITDWLKVRTIVDRITSAAEGLDLDSSDESTDVVLQESDEALQDVQETFAPTVDDLALTLVAQAIDSTGVPVELMQKRHKLQVVQELEARGLFLLRDAVDLTARMLGISRESVYNYLKESRDESAQRLGSTHRRLANRNRLQLPEPHSSTVEE